MGNLNNFAYRYLSLAQYNADLWNGTVFHGKRKVKKWQLERWNRERYRKQNNRFRKFNRETRDVKMCCKGKKDVILAVRVVNVLDGQMLSRIWDYDLRELDRRASRQEPLIPIHRVVLYCGGKGTADLRELVKGDLVQESQNYWMRVYSLKELDEENFETSMREIVAVFKRKDSLESVESYYVEHKERFGTMDDISIDLLGVLLGIRNLKEFKQEGGGVDLCKAFDEARKEGWQKGREKGQQEGRQEGAFGTLCCLVEKELLMLKDAAKEAGMSEEAFQEQMQLFAEYSFNN